ncbi:hypothetical protein BCV72DRAFT_115488 [Rhizopus microsporus var. microsporus]|uniref:Secreted protein n=1 Tax=Rhizopus microsporus var. microsporus TaxID=86635 RepID=A0A1X0RH08_RHIZD|nr:hypothetical protein BCV72DRAFT_115488 [Rhizopus microsporus var. microsporus]
MFLNKLLVVNLLFYYSINATNIFQQLHLVGINAALTSFMHKLYCKFYKHAKLVSENSALITQCRINERPNSQMKILFRLLQLTRKNDAFFLKAPNNTCLKSMLVKTSSMY